MATLATNLYLKLLNGERVVSPAMQKQIYASAVAENDSSLIAALAAVPNLLPELDEAIGKRKSAKELAAWCARPGRTAAELRARIPKESRVAVLTVIAEREGLEQRDYEALAAKTLEKVNLALLRNPTVEEPAKKVAALSWMRSLSPSQRNHWAFRRTMEEVLAVVPDAYNELLVHTKSRDVILASMLNELNATSQNTVLTSLVAPVLAEISGKNGKTVHWNETRDADVMFDRLNRMLAMDFVTAEFRSGLESLLDAHGPWNAQWQYGYFSQPEKERAKMLAELRMGHGGTSKSPLNIARTSTNPAQLLAVATKAAKERESGVCLAVALNPASSLEAFAMSLQGMGWEGTRTVMRRVAELGQYDRFASVVVEHPYVVDDDVIDAAPEPSELLRVACRAMIKQSASLHPRHMWGVLESRYLTSEVVSEFSGEFLAAAPLNETVVAAVTALLDTELGENTEHWQLFEALLATGDTPLKEVLRTAKAI